MSSLSFRDNTLSKKLRAHMIYVSVLFIASLTVFFVLLNLRPKGRGNSIGAGAAPICHLESSGIALAEMHGYLTEMDGCYMRESLVPVPDDRKIDLVIDKYKNDISDVSYEIRSMDTERKIADGACEKISDKKGTLRTAFSVTSLLEENEEYLLALSVRVGDRNYRYYTRIMDSSNEHVSECLDFAKYFHDTAISGDASALGQYLETDDTQDANTLSRVTIRSSLSQVSWKAFEGKLIGEPVVRFTELGDDYAAIVYDYQRRDEKKGIYNVEEYFKVRYTRERMYLLDYERTMEEIPRKKFKVNVNDLTVGVTNEDFKFRSNDTGTVAAFVQSGQMYEYNENTGAVRKVFGFRGEDLSDPHTNYNQHGIRILSVDENGSIDFVVYGYMNSGRREGYNGIGLYRYDAGEDMVDEQAFVSIPRPYPVLDASFSELLYKSPGGFFYVMIDGTLTRINSETDEATELLTGMMSGQYAISGSGRYLAWIDKEDADRQIHVLDMESGADFDIKPPEEGQLLKPLAFLEDNICYGVVRDGDIGVDASGNRIYPAYKVVIREVANGSDKVLKEYQKEGSYISAATSNSYTLFLERVAKNGDHYEQTDDDTIQNSSGEPGGAVEMENVADDIKGLVTHLILSRISGLEEDTAAVIEPVAILFLDEDTVATLNVSDVHEDYYVYVGNKVILASTKVTQAIKSADRKMGIVVDNKQRNIWKRTRKAYVNPFTNMASGSSDADSDTTSKAISAMLVREGENVEVHTLLEAGASPVEVLSGTLKEASVLDLAGCSLDQVLYFVSCGNPVYARLPDNGAGLIVGYDASNIFFFNPDSGKTAKMGRNDAAEEFDQTGNIFISYIK